MAELTELFDEAVRHKGGRLDPATLGRNHRTLYDYFLKVGRQEIEIVRNSAPTLPAIHLDIIKSKQIEAFATKYSGVYLIAISEAALGTIVNLNKRFFGDRRVAQYVAAAKSLDKLPPGYRAHTECLAFRFLVLHELHHIANGHLDFWKAEFGLQEFSEFSWTADSASKGLIRQTLEMDADASALNEMLRRVHRCFTNPSAKPPEPLAVFYSTAEQAMFDLAISIFLFFRVLGTDATLRKDAAHPPLPHRVRLLAASASHYVVKVWDPSIDEQLAMMFMNAKFEVERGFSTIMGEDPQIGILRAMDGYDYDYAMLMNEVWDDLRKKLEPHAHKPLGLLRDSPQS